MPVIVTSWCMSDGLAQAWCAPMIQMRKLSVARLHQGIKRLKAGLSYQKSCKDISTRLPGCHQVSASLPRTHVWCSGRKSALLLGIPAWPAPPFSSSSLTLDTSFPTIFAAFLPPSRNFLPYSEISHVLTRLSDTSDCVAACALGAGWDFARTATPRGFT